MRAAGVEPLDWADARGGRARRSRRPRRSSSRCRRTRPATRCWRGTRRGARGGAGALGRLSLDHRRLRRPAGRLGRRDERARAGARARALAGGGGGGVARDRAAGARSSGSPASTGRGAASLDKLREGRAQRVVKPGQVFSRIHVEDIARALRASMARPAPGRGATTSPTTSRRRREDVIAFAAELLGLPVPPEVAVRGGGALADGAELLGASRSGCRTGGSSEELGVELRLARLSGRACAGILAAGG